MPTINRIPRWCVLVVLLLLAVLAFLHLNADFPHFSRWMDDPSRFTDEGWYASGAINHILTGHWLRPGDFNPAVVIPVWPALLEVLFHFAGITLAGARALSVSFNISAVLAGYLLLRRTHPRWALVFALLLASNPTAFYFTRSAFLESPLVFFLVVTAVLANSDKPAPWRSVLCGVCFALAMLTKSSALFVAPALLYLLWKRTPRILNIALPLLTVILIYGAYWLTVIHTHPADFNTLYRENGVYLGINSVKKIFRIVYRSFTWIDSIGFLFACACVGLAFTKLRTLRDDPLFGFAILWYLGYSAFMVLHYEASPHYFVVLIFPVMLLWVLLLGSLEPAMPKAAVAFSAAALLAVVLNLGYIVRLMLHPQYSLLNACTAIRQQIDADPTATPLVIGHGAIETTFYTRIPALDDIGFEPVFEKLERDHPGWVITYSDNLAILTRPGVAESYRFLQQGSYPVFDQPNRSRMLLFRIEKK